MVTNYVFWANSEDWQIPPSFLALAFHNKLEYCYVEGRFKSGDDSSISCGNMVSFDQVTAEITRPECVQQASVLVLV